MTLDASPETLSRFPRSRLSGCMRGLAVVLVVCACAPTGPNETEPPDASVIIPLADAGLNDAGEAVDAGVPSHGATLTFESIGAAGWFPSSESPNTCDVQNSNSCCLSKKTITSDALTPWDEDLIVTLRGPMHVERFTVYQPNGSSWSRVSDWSAGATTNLSTDTVFDGDVGTECLVNVASDALDAKRKHLGWSGSKLILMLASMPDASEVPGRCSTNDTGNWFNAPWVGVSLGELVRAGAFGSCHCYAKDPAKWWLSDGCGQFNAFEVVNDNNQFKNLEVFSSNFIGYAGYVGEGPCGAACDVSRLDDAVDLIDKSHSTEAAMGATASPGHGPGAAFRRPHTLRWFALLFDVPSRTVQLAMIHPDGVPPGVKTLLPSLPTTVDSSVISSLRTLRLPN